MIRSIVFERLLSLASKAVVRSSVYGYHEMNQKAVVRSSLHGFQAIFFTMWYDHMTGIMQGLEVMV